MPSQRLRSTIRSLSASDAGEHWGVAPPDWRKNCDQPQPPNVTEAIADRECYRRIW